MRDFEGVPESAYGVLQQDRFDTDIEEASEQVRRLGYAILSSDCSASELGAISDAFESARANYIEKWGEDLEQAERRRALAADMEAVARFMELLQS